MPKTKIKICGVKDIGIAEFCVKQEVDFIGLNFSSISKRKTNIETAREVLELTLGTPTKCVALFYLTPEEEIRKVLDTLVFDYIQFVTEDSLHTLYILQEYNTPLIPQIPIKESFTEEDLYRYNSDLIILDNFKQGSGGGTGEAFDWSKIQNVKRDYFLAGGLNPSNIKTAIQTLQPFGVDTASGVESSPGVKDKNLIEEFIKNVKDA